MFPDFRASGIQVITVIFIGLSCVVLSTSHNSSLHWPISHLFCVLFVQWCMTIKSRKRGGEGSISRRSKWHFLTLTLFSFVSHTHTFLKRCSPLTNHDVTCNKLQMSLIHSSVQKRTKTRAK